MIASAVLPVKKEQGLSAPCRQLRLLYDGNALLCPVSYHYGKGTADFLCGGDFLAGCIFCSFYRSLYPEDLHGKLPGVVSVLGAVVIVCLVMAFQIFGPSLFFSGCFGITAGTIVLRCMEVLRREKEHHFLDGIMLSVAWLQVLLYIVSEFIKDYTRFNLYFAVDITLTLTMAYLFFALRKEVERG